MGEYGEPTIHIDLGETVDEFEGFYVDILNPKLMTWAEEQQITRARDMGKDDPSKGVQKTLEIMVKDWNLVDRKGDAIPISKEGFASAPSVAIAIVMRTIGTKIRETIPVDADGNPGDEVPKGSSTES